MKNARHQRQFTSSLARRELRRRLLAEGLESRQLLAGDIMPHHNYYLANDVNADFNVTPLDALLVINALNGSGPRDLLTPRGPNEFVLLDVNADGNLSPLDALGVINRLNGGPEAEEDFRAELRLDVSRGGTSLLNNQQFSVNVGEDFDLEVKWLDKRSGSAALGLFAVYADILASNSEQFIPVVGETFVFRFTDKRVVTAGQPAVTVANFNVDMTANNQTVNITDSVINSATLFQQRMNTLFGAGNTRVVRSVESLDPNAQVGAESSVTIAVNVIGSDLVLRDVPNIVVDASKTVVNNGTLAQAFQESNIPAVQNLNNDGVITSNEINPLAMRFSIDPISASRGLTDIDNNIAPRPIFVNGRSGSYVADAGSVGGFREVFDELGAFGGTQTISAFADSNGLAYNVDQPFEAFSVKVRAIAPTAGTPIQFKVDLADGQGRDTLLYGIDYNLPPFNAIDPNSLVQITNLGTVTGTFLQADVFSVGNDTATVNEDSSVTINVLANDNDVGVNPPTLDSIVTQPTNGTAEIQGTQILYRPNANFPTGGVAVTDTFVYRIRSAANTTLDGTVTVTVNPVNDPPTVQTKTLTTGQGQPATITVATLLTGATAGGNETGQTLSVVSAGPSSQQNGTVSFNGSNGEVVYTPPAGFTGSDSFTFVVSDGQSANNTVSGTVNVTVNAASTNAESDTFTVSQDSSANVLLVLGNDTGSNLTVASVTQPATGGSVTIASDSRSLLFTPTAGFAGTATFSYVASGTNGTDNASVTVTVTPTVVNNPPNAGDDSFTVNQGSSANVFTVLTNDNPGVGETGSLTIESVTQPANGSVTISGDKQTVSFTPAASFTGTTTFTYTISDGEKTDTATVTVDVASTARPLAVRDLLSMNEGGVLNINIPAQLLQNDVPNTGATVLFNQLSPFNGVGTLVRDGNTITYTPPENFVGKTTFTYTITDSTGVVDNAAAATGTVEITVNGVNDAPSGADKTVTVVEDSFYTFTAADFGFTDANDTPANSLAAVRVTTLPASGSLALSGVAVTAGQAVTAANLASGSLRFTPAANSNATASFTFQVQDNGGTANGGVDLDPSANVMTINVTPVNDAPAGSDKTVVTLEDSAYTFTVADFGFTDTLDTPANLLSGVRIASLPSAGSLLLNGSAVTAGQTISAANITAGSLRFTPAANANGNNYASFTFQVQDNGGVANGGVDLDPSANTIVVNVTSVNDAPSGANTTVATLKDVTYSFKIADFGFSDANDSPANTLSGVRIATLPNAGSLILNGAAVTAGQVVSAANISAGNLRFVPGPNASGNAFASFTFQVQDNGGVANGGVDLDATPNTITVDIQTFQPSSFSGSIIFDVNQNGVLDPGEQALGGIPVTITGGGVLGTIEETVLTDSNGNYSFGDLVPGTYTVSFESPPGLLVGNSSSPGSDTSFSFTVGDAGGSNLTGNRFTIESVDPEQPQGEAMEVLDLLFSTLILNGGSGGSQQVVGGLTIQTDVDGDVVFYRSEGDFNGVARIEAEIGANVSLTVYMNDGSVRFATIEANKVLMVNYEDGSKLIRIVGGLSSHNFQTVPANGSGSFASSADLLFSNL